LPAIFVFTPRNQHRAAQRSPWGFASYSPRAYWCRNSTPISAHPHQSAMLQRAGGGSNHRSHVT